MKGDLRKSLKLVTTGRCQRCRGTGQEAHYDQMADVVRGSKVVAKTVMTAYRRCTGCGGTGKAR